MLRIAFAPPLTCEGEPAPILSQPYTRLSSASAQLTASADGMPWTALAYMSVMMYLDSTSAALAPEGPAYPGARPSRPATLYGAMTGSSPQSLCSSHCDVQGVAKPFCEMNQRS